MPTVGLVIQDAGVDLSVRALEGTERLGEASCFEIEALSVEPIDGRALVGARAAVHFANDLGERAIVGVVTRVTAKVTSQVGRARIYKVLLRSELGVLELRNRTRVFQHLSAPDIISAVLSDAGISGDRIRRELSGAHPPREYVVQYAETDAGFVRRICEEHGLYTRFVADGGKEFLVLADTSGSAETRCSLTLSNANDLRATELAACDCALMRRRRPGKVVLRDYDPKRPAFALEGEATAGTPLEQETEVYEAPGRFRTASEGEARARLALEALRAEASKIAFKTNALELAPGDAFELVEKLQYAGPAPAEGEYFVVAMRHTYRFDGGDYEIDVEAIPRAVPYRLPRVTPRPRIPGVQVARVSGAKGEEIHPDGDGSIFVKFPWDREGPDDHKSSLPVRVAQPNTPGSMVLPRVDWEVWVVFEDGDPERPYVIGRTYNAKQPPPFALPKNKTVTSVATHSSPGGKGLNSVNFDDGAGRQHLAINAAFGKHVTAAGKMLTQTVKVEERTVKGSQTLSVGANEDVSVGQAYIVACASQSATVGGMQQVFVKGNFTIAPASENVGVGAALLEKVGNPVMGARNLAVSAALAVAGQRGLGGMAISTLGGAAWAGFQASEHAAPGQEHAARDAAARGLLGAGMGLIPGGDAILGSVSSFGVRMPWEDPPAPPGDQAAGGGSSGAQSDAGGAAGPGPGHRNTIVNGTCIEIIAGAYGVATPGSVNWQTSGGSVLDIAGSHNTKAVSVGYNTLGTSRETLGSMHVTCDGKMTRTARGSVSTNVKGGLTSSAGGMQSITAKTAIRLKIGGALTMNGGHVVFKVGSSVVAASPGGVYIHGATVTITDLAKQSGQAVHQGT